MGGGDAGIAVPRVAALQQAAATPVPISLLAPATWCSSETRPTTSGIYVGGGLMVDASHGGANIAWSPIWWDDLAGFGRLHSR